MHSSIAIKKAVWVEQYFEASLQIAGSEGAQKTLKTFRFTPLEAPLSSSNAMAGSYVTHCVGPLSILGLYRLQLLVKNEF